MFINSHIIVHNPYPVFISGLRVFSSGCLLLLLYFIQNQQNFLQDIKQVWSKGFVWYTLYLYVFSLTCFSWAVQYIDPVKACFMLVLSPFVTAILLFFGYKERLTSRKMLGLFIGCAAIIPIILESDHGVFKEVSWYHSVIGYCTYFFAVATFAYGWILKKQFLNTSKVPVLLATGSALFMGGSITLLFAGVFQQYQIMHMALSDDFWMIMGAFICTTSFSYFLYGYLLKKFSPTFLSFAGFLEPVFGLLYGMLLFNHPITVVSLLSLLVLGCGLFLFYQEELRLLQ
jgi:drug/metabolite transporter (DMT)-like permease